MCVELAAEYGFNIANPELQKAIAAEREWIRTRGRERSPDRESRPAEIPETRTPAEVYRRHREDVTRARPGQPIHPSRVDAEIAVRMRLRGHRRDDIVRVIKEAAAAERPHEIRDCDAHAKRTVAIAFGVPGDRLAEYLRRQDDRLRRLEGQPLARGRGLQAGDLIVYARVATVPASGFALSRYPAITVDGVARGSVVIDTSADGPVRLKIGDRISVRVRYSAPPDVMPVEQRQDQTADVILPRFLPMRTFGACVATGYSNTWTCRGARS